MKIRLLNQIRFDCVIRLTSKSSVVSYNCKENPREELELISRDE